MSCPNSLYFPSLPLFGVVMKVYFIDNICLVILFLLSSSWSLLVYHNYHYYYFCCHYHYYHNFHVRNCSLCYIEMGLKGVLYRGLALPTFNCSQLCRVGCCLIAIILMLYSRYSLNLFWRPPNTKHVNFGSRKRIMLCQQSFIST